MKRLKNLKMLILSMAITGILGFNSVFAMNGDGVPNQQNNNINIVDQILMKEHYQLWIQMMQEIIDVLEDDTNKDKVNKYRQNLQQIIAGNFTNNDQIAQADVEGRENLLSAIKIKVEEMVQKILLFRTEMIPNLNIDNSQKQKLQRIAKDDCELISEMFDCTIDDTDRGAGQSLFKFFNTRIVKYNKLKHDLEIIRNNNFPQDNDDDDISREYRTITDDIRDNDDNISADDVKRSFMYWKKYIREIANSMANEDSRKSVMSNLQDLEVIENYNTIDYNYNKVKAKKVERGIGQLCLAMKKKIDEMNPKLVDVNNVGRNVMDMIIPNNINENERRKLGVERNDLIQTIKQLVNGLSDLKKNARASYILKNQFSYTGGSNIIGDEFYNYFKVYVEKYNNFMVDAQNFLNKVAQLQNNNNQ